MSVGSMANVCSISDNYLKSFPCYLNMCQMCAKGLSDVYQMSVKYMTTTSGTSQPKVTIGCIKFYFNAFLTQIILNNFLKLTPLTPSPLKWLSPKVILRPAV